MQTYDEKPKHRLFELLQSHGLQPNQQVAFLSDGSEDVRSVQLHLHPDAERLLDWFHVTMRSTVLKQIAKGLPEKAGEGQDQYEWRPRVLTVGTPHFGRRLKRRSRKPPDPQESPGLCELRGPTVLTQDSQGLQMASRFSRVAASQAVRIIQVELNLAGVSSRGA